MDSKKLLVLVVVAIIAVAAVGIVIASMNKGDEGSLKVSYLKKVGYETQMVADEKGFFKEAGINVESVPVTGSGQDAVNLLLSGDVDIAATGEGPVATTLNKYLDNTVIVCGVNLYTGGHVWVSKAGTGLVAYDKTLDNKAAVLDSFKTASGDGATPLKVGVQKGSTTESEFKGWLKAMGITFNDFADDTPGKYVKLIDLKANTLVSAMATGDIDMLAASQPYPSQALSQITGSFKVGTNADVDSYSIAVYITTKAVYDEKKGLIEKFIKGLDLASKWMADPAHEEECVNICAKVIGGADAKNTVQAAYDISEWKVAWSDKMANTLYKTCQKKGFTSITEEICSNKCLFKEYIATL